MALYNFVLNLGGKDEISVRNKDTEIIILEDESSFFHSIAYRFWSIT